MLKPVYSNRFKKDVKLAVKRGKNLEKLVAVFEILCSEQSVPSQYRDHSLGGKYETHLTLIHCHLATKSRYAYPVQSFW